MYLLTHDMEIVLANPRFNVLLLPLIVQPNPLQSPHLITHTDDCGEQQEILPSTGLQLAHEIINEQSVSDYFNLLSPVPLSSSSSTSLLSSGSQPLSCSPTLPSIVLLPRARSRTSPRPANSSWPSTGTCPPRRFSVPPCWASTTWP